MVVVHVEPITGERCDHNSEKVKKLRSWKVEDASVHYGFVGLSTLLQAILKMSKCEDTLQLIN